VADRGNASNAAPVSVVIPTWNGAHFLPTCLDSIRRQTLRAFETIVVDNGSTDDTGEVLAAYPEVQVVRLPQNVGFAPGVNAGIEAARGATIVLLNNDTEAEPRWLAALTEALHSAPDVGMATSKLRLFDRRDVLHTTGDTVDLAGRAANRGVWEPDTGQWDDKLDVFGASGAAAAYKRQLFESVGMFEAAFGSYLEDVDLAWRARLAGWRCVYAPDAVVYHRVSATGGGPTASYYVGRNRIWLIARNYPSGLLRKHLRLVAGALLGELAAALAAWRGREARASLRGLAVGLLTWPRMLPARRAIQSTRRLSDEELERLLSGS
jgi:GT2 family glycosyltransferase